MSTPRLYTKEVGIKPLRLLKILEKSSVVKTSPALYLQNVTSNHKIAVSVALFIASPEKVFEF